MSDVNLGTSENSQLDFENFVGVNATKFAKTRYRLKTGRKSDFSWLALLFPLAWSAYYKYTLGIILGLVSLGLSLFAGIMLVRYEQFARQNNVLAEESLGFAVIAWIVILLISVFTGYFLKSLYVRYVIKKTEELKKYESDPEALKVLYKDVGGTSRSNMILASFAILFAVIAPEIYKASLHSDSPATLSDAQEQISNDEGKHYEEMDSEAEENAELQPPPMFGIEQRQSFMNDHKGLENMRQLIELCESPVMAGYVNDEALKQAKETFRQIDELSTGSYESCYRFPRKDIMMMKAEGAKRFSDSADGKMLKLALTATGDQEVLMNFANGCAQLPATINQLYAMGVEKGRIFPKDCPR